MKKITSLVIGLIFGVSACALFCAISNICNQNVVSSPPLSKQDRLQLNEHPSPDKNTDIRPQNPWKAVKNGTSKFDTGYFNDNYIDEETLKKFPNIKRLLQLAWLKSNKKLDISVPLVDENGKFSSNFKELFDLTDIQLMEIEGQIDILRSQLISEGIDPTHINREGHKVTVEIPPSETAIDYFDRFMDLMYNYLGPERFPAFFRLSGKQFDPLFNGYGGESKYITIESTGDDIDKISVTEIRLTQRGPFSRTYEHLSRKEFYDRYPGLEKLVP